MELCRSHHPAVDSVYNPAAHAAVPVVALLLVAHAAAATMPPLPDVFARGAAEGVASTAAPETQWQSASIA